MNTANLHKILPAPPKPGHISHNVQWLSGEGAGSWFLLEKENVEFIVTRFSQKGKIECKGIFYKVNYEAFNINEKYEFTYLSHCAEVNINQNGIKYKFKLKEKCI